MPPNVGGEGMTGSRYRLPTAGTPALTSATPHPHQPQEHHTRAFSADHSVRRPAPASSPSGRSRGRAAPEP
jgi:hypothetical protein